MLTDVVKCKYCKRYTPSEDGDNYCKNHPCLYDDDTKFFVRENDFCSKFEKEEGDENG